MQNWNVSTDAKLLRIALAHLRSAIDILDATGAPAHLAAHVDLARHQLEEAVRERVEVDNRADPSAARMH